MARTASRELFRRVGRRVAELRARSGLTQEALATALGIATKNLQRIEGGSQNLTLASLDALAACLGVDPRDLLTPPAPSPHPRRTARDTWLDGLAEIGAEVLDAEAPGALPVTTLQAAAGHLARAQSVEAVAWARLPGRHARAEPGSFLARVVGASMAPRIPDGAWCLFRGPATLHALGGLALVAAREPGDDDARYYVKRVERVPGRRPRLRLESLAPGYAPIELTPTEGAVLAELVAVLRAR